MWFRTRAQTYLCPNHIPGRPNHRADLQMTYSGESLPPDLLWPDHKHTHTPYKRTSASLSPFSDLNTPIISLQVIDNLLLLHIIFLSVSIPDFCIQSLTDIDSQSITLFQYFSIGNMFYGNTVTDDLHLHVTEHAMNMPYRFAAPTI